MVSIRLTLQKSCWSSCGTGQAGCLRRAAIDDGRAGTVGQRIARDLILAGERDIALALRISEETVEGSHPARMAGDSVVQACHHHAPPMRPLLVKLVKLVAQRLLVSSGIPVHEGKRHDVVHVKGVGDGHKISSAHRYDKRLIVAWFVDVIEKAQVL